MSAIDKVRERLETHPELSYRVKGKTITVDARSGSGFSVWLTVNRHGFTVGFDGWHEEFGEESKALEAFAFGFSDCCRLKVVKRGNTACSWTVEGREENGEWTEDSETGLFFFPFWRKKCVEYRQNRVIVTHGRDGNARVEDTTRGA